MSPEQATGDRVVDQRSDIYSLGAVLYECLSGDPPHTASTAQAIIAKVLTDQPRSVRATRPHVPAHVDATLERALEKLPADRFKTAQEFADALQGKSTVSLRSEHAGAWRAGRGSRTIARAAASATLWAAAFLVAAGVAVWQAISAPRVPDDTSVQFLLGFPPNYRMYQGTGAGKTLAISPDGRRVAYAAIGVGTPRRLLVRSLDDVTSRFLEGTEGATQPSFSPDGNWIAFVSDQQLKKARVDGGGVQVLADVGQQFGIHWAWRDSIVVAVGNALAIVFAEGGALRRFAQLEQHLGTLRWPRVLDDGESILITVWTGAGVSAKLAVVSMKDGSLRPLGINGTSSIGVVDDHLLYSSAGAALHVVPFDTRRLRPTGPAMLVTNTWVGGTGAAAADLSSNGSLVYQSGSATAHLALFDATGGSRPLFPEARPYSQPRYSPNGRQIAVVVAGAASADVHIYDIAAGTLTRLSTQGIINDRPEWTPDGKRVLYRSERDDDLALWWQPVDFSGRAELLYRRKERNLWEGYMAPDNQTLLFRTGTIGSADIYARRITGDTTPWPLANSPFTEWCPRVSPDGRWLAYSADDSRMMEVYVRPMAASGARVQVSAGGGACPVWSRDGRTLYYANNQAFYAASVRTQPEFGVVNRRRLFESDFTDTPGHPNYDVSPRGEILMVKPTVSTDEVRVIHNWRAQLRQRLAQAGAAR